MRLALKVVVQVDGDFVEVILLYLPCILESNPHLFTVSEGLKIRCGLESRAD